MEVIIVDRSSGRNPQRIDTAHIAEYTLADIVGMIEGHFVMVGAAGAVAPDPAQRKRGIVQVVHIVKPYDIVRRVTDPHPDTGWMQTSGMGDEAVFDGVM